MIPSIEFSMLLAPGDRMELEEFLDRWEKEPGLKFAELIDGVVYMPSPVAGPHADIDGLIRSIFGHYRLRSGICKNRPNATWLMLGSALQPDLALSLKPEYGGRMRITTRELTTGLPELVVEVCRSSRSYDLGPKLVLYERAGVPEYLAILVEEKRFEWRRLVQSQYQLLKPGNGVYRSRILPGLWLDEAAFWREDETRLLAVLDEGLNSPELLAFKRGRAPE